MLPLCLSQIDKFYHLNLSPILITARVRSTTCFAVHGGGGTPGPTSFPRGREGREGRGYPCPVQARGGKGRGYPSQLLGQGTPSPSFWPVPGQGVPSPSQDKDRGNSLFLSPARIRVAPSSPPGPGPGQGYPSPTPGQHTPRTGYTHAVRR